MSRLLIFQTMMGLTVVCGLLMALWLLKHGRRRDELKPLAAFNLLMALWCLGHWLLSLDHPFAGQILLSLNPLLPTAFLHFALLFVGNRTQLSEGIKRLGSTIGLAYGLSTVVVVVSIGFSGNRVEPWLDFPWFLRLGQIGWVNLLYTVAIGVLGHSVLLWGYAKSRGNTRRSIMMMFAVGAWGFILATSYIFPSVGWRGYPYPLWLVPSYLLLLTFAVLRYQVLEVNRWAIKTLIWSGAIILLLGLTTLLTSIASPLGLPHLSKVPLSVLWLYSTSTGLMLWLLYKPLHRLASRLVYPDVNLTEAVIDEWLNKLGTCHSFNELRDIAQETISAHLRLDVIVAIDQPVKSGGLLIRCYREKNHWQFALENWDDVTPGIRHAADIFASLLYTSCSTLDKSLLLAQQEQQRQEELRLVELGGLAASMAHELRNPLNIISMASARCDDKVKQHIQQQLKRADTLIQDLLSYARVIELHRQHFTLLPMLESLRSDITGHYNVEMSIVCSGETTLYADPFKLQQVLVNLLENAGSFAQTVESGAIVVECREGDGLLEIAVHNNGPRIPRSFQQELFKPFISKRPGGSGLGLAIVKRIVEAHGGKLAFSEQLGWNVSFICQFPDQE